MSTINITPDLVSSINTALSKGLVKGIGQPVEGEMCIEALICFKLGLPHDDNPPCVGNAIRKAKILLNDCNWSSNAARAEGMRKLAVAQLNSVLLDQDEFKARLKLKSMQTLLPYLIQKHYDKTQDAKLLEYKAKFAGLTALDDALWKEFNNYDYSYSYYNYYYYNYYNYYGDEWFLLVADTILQTLIDMNCEGCRFVERLDV